jgi:histidyl-tRNA synthetase
LRHLGVEPPPEPLPQVIVSYLGDEAKLAALRLVEILRTEQIGVLFTAGDRSFKAQLKVANRINAVFALIIGEDEARAGQATIRDLKNGEQITVNLAAVAGWLKENLRAAK